MNRINDLEQKVKEEKWMKKMEYQQKEYDRSRSIYQTMCELDISMYNPIERGRYKTRLKIAKARMIQYQVKLLRTAKGLDVL